MKLSLALLLLLLAFPCGAQELRPTDPAILYYVVIPLDGASRAERTPVVGFALQGRRASQSLRFDTRMLNLIGSGAFEAKWLLVGAVAAGAAVAAGGKDKSVSSHEKAQERALQQQAQQPPPSSCSAKPAC